MGAIRVLTPLTPLDFPNGSHYITDVAVSGAVRHADTSVLEFLVAAGLPLRTQDLARAAAHGGTFDVLVHALRLPGTEVRRLAPQILFDTRFHHNPANVLPCLKHLVGRYRLDLNTDEVRSFLLEIGSIDLLEAAVVLGLGFEAHSFEMVNPWIGKRASQEFRSAVMSLCGFQVPAEEI
ncbi:hypothetical protein C8R46DRAFT_1349162 [Mycena filopes]|nr:hypothetical protein C8R46DRAFT_1349162 [Mycena filopes]